jgi:hypothetical protein
MAKHKKVSAVKAHVKKAPKKRHHKEVKKHTMVKA